MNIPNNTFKTVDMVPGTFEYDYVKFKFESTKAGRR